MNCPINVFYSQIFRLGKRRFASNRQYTRRIQERNTATTSELTKISRFDQCGTEPQAEVGVLPWWKTHSTITNGKIIAQQMTLPVTAPDSHKRIVWSIGQVAISILPLFFFFLPIVNAVCVRTALKQKENILWCEMWMQSTSLLSLY